MTLSPKKESPILHMYMYTIFEDSGLHSFVENCHTNSSLKRQKNGQIKGKIKARRPILNPTIKQLIAHV